MPDSVEERSDVSLVTGRLRRMGVRPADDVVTDAGGDSQTDLAVVSRDEHRIVADNSLAGVFTTTPTRSATLSLVVVVSSTRTNYGAGWSIGLAIACFGWG